MANKRKPRSSRFDVAGAPAIPRRSPFEKRIPMRWVNTLIGIFLLPVAFIWTQTFFTVFSQLPHAGKGAFWLTEEFWFFALGAILWVIAFFGLPRPLLLYVFGHEFTHALWVWLMGGKVSEFAVSRDGGHIVTNKHNVWIALAPYFFPLYSMLVIILFGIAGMFFDLTPDVYHRCLYALIGATWAFHTTFTLWMIPKGQTDLTYHGTFYSLTVIYLMNLLVLTIFLMVALPRATPRRFAKAFRNNTVEFSAWVCSKVR
ncbi:MAG: hypothetical protein WCD79_19215 [Chthoniobacteraceae bacterium]